jgi:hypothetical protein
MLRPGSRLTNIERSLTAYAKAMLGGGGLLILAPRDAMPPAFPIWWLRLDYIPLGQRRQAGRVRVGIGYERQLLVNCNVHEQIAARSQNLPQVTFYSMPQLIDQVCDAFGPSAAIPIRDYDTAGTPIVSALHWREIRQTDVPSPAGMLVEIRNISVTVGYEEEHI